MKASAAAEREASDGVTAPADRFTALYEEHFAFVWRVLRHLGVPPAGLDDAAQDVFVVVHRRLADFQGRSAERTWIYGITRRVAREHRERAARYALPPVEAVPSVGRGPHDQLVDKQAALEVARFLAELDDDKREVFLLAELEQLPAPNIAAMLDLGVNTVYSRLRLARERFAAFVARRQARDRSES
jgi:RNA polymerase sigma-70 factor (ECF subfamily)